MLQGPLAAYNPDFEYENEVLSAAISDQEKYHGVLDMSEDNASFVVEDVKFSRGFVDEVIRRGFDPMDVVIYSDKGSIKAKYEGRFPGGQKELDRVISEYMQKHGPAECYFNFRGLSEYIEMRKLETSLRENNIQVLEKNDDGTSMKLKHAGSLQKLSDAVINTVSELFDNTKKF